MTYTILILTNRNSGISTAQSKHRYENHMALVQELCAKAGRDTFPVSHTRYYPLPDSEISPPGALDGTAQAASNGDGGRADGIVVLDVVVALEFEDRSGWERLCGALGTGEARRVTEEDEDGFWEGGG